MTLSNLTGLTGLTGPGHFLDRVSTTALRLYRAESLDAILRTTVQDVRRLLNADRVVIYQLNAEGQAQAMAIASNPNLPDLPDHTVNLGACLQQWLREVASQRPKAIDDLAKADLSPCDQSLLASLGIQAGVLTPIYLSLNWQQVTGTPLISEQRQDVWGFLVAQHSQPRHWSPLESAFLHQITQHLFHAIQQVQLRQFSECLIESAVDGILVIDPNFRYQVWNQPMERLSGLSRQEVVGRVVWEVFPFLKETGEDKLIAMALAGQAVVAQNRAFVVNESGCKGFFEARYSPLMDATGKVLGCLGLVRDITDQKRAEYQLRATSSRLSTLIQNLQAGVLVEDKNRHILLANPTFCEIFRLPLSPKALEGPGCGQLLAQVGNQFANPETTLVMIERILQARQPVLGEEIALVDGRVLERDYIPIFIDNDYQGHLWQYRDITHRKQVQQQLEAAIQAAETANRAKSNFLATMSHEIRTPLNAIIGLTDLLRLTQLDDEQQDFVDTIHNSGSMLLSLINDVLDFSKIEAEKLELEHRAFDLHRCVQEVVSLITPLAQEKGLVVRSHIAADVPTRVVGDVIRLRQVLLNLLNNGVKFTQQGSVTVEVKLNQSFAPVAHTVELYFAVQDTGIGIADESRHALFQAFSQLDASVARRYGGSGLGLAICKSLVEAMGGQIGVNTQLSVGTTFHFTIQVPVIPTGAQEGNPLETDATPSPRLNDPQPLAPQLPLSLLIVDDLAVNQKVVIKMLQWLGYEPDYAASGLDALDLIQQRAYDVVLMDIQMPGMDGYETTDAIRQLPQTTPDYPWIVAMTAHSNQEDRQRCLQAGMNDFLSKPIVLASLTERLIHYGQTYHPDRLTPFSGSALADHSAQAAGAETAQPLLDQEMISTIREMAGAEAESLLTELISNYREDATQCLDQLHQAVQQQTPEMIRHQAHALRSMSLNLGARSLGALCQELELHHSAMDLAAQTRLLTRISTTYDDVMVALVALVQPSLYA